MADYNVYQRDDGSWAGKREEASRAAVVAATQKEAYDATRDVVERAGGGDISIHGRDGKIRDKNTIPPAKDPRITKG